MYLSKFFTLEEMTFSQRAARDGIPNRPNADEVENLRRLCVKILDPLRKELGPVVVSSGFRGPLLNKAVKGARNSQHLTGCAADISVPGIPVATVIATIRRLKLPFDQLIDEFGAWTHVSYTLAPRGEVLKARRGADGKTVYTRIP